MSDIIKQSNSNIVDATLTAADTFDSSSNGSYSVNDVETGAAVVQQPPPALFTKEEIHALKRVAEQAKSTPSSNDASDSDRCGGIGRLGRIGWLLIVGVAIAMFFIGLSVGWAANNSNSSSDVVQQQDSTGVSSTHVELDVPNVENISLTNNPSDDYEPTTEVLNELDAPSDIALATTSSPSQQPTPTPSNAPTPSPSSPPTLSPTTSKPTSPPTQYNPYFFGTEFVTVDDLGIEMSSGLNVRLIAKTGDRVQYANGDESNDAWHTASDAAGIVPLNPNDLSEGYVYMSNSEESDGNGGVYGLYFDRFGNITEYKPLLTGTTDNCGGGLTPWNTFITCEEFEDGQCWQIDPVTEKAEVTLLGGDGGRYESVAVDNRNVDAPVFFTTEDDEEGALRRFVANGNGWDALHTEGETTFLNILDDNEFEWTDDEDDGRKSAKKYFPNTEGIQVHEGKVYFMSKELQELIILDLDTMTYETEQTGLKFYGEGSFEEQPDQNLFGPTRKYIYFTEDGGDNPGVYARYGSDETYFTMFQAIEGGIHSGGETIGIALSPDHTRFYAGFQDEGYIFEFTREDGLAFE